MRPGHRADNQMRPIQLETNVNKYAEGACRIQIGDTHVLCTASIEEKTPFWLRHSGKGWVTAEYGMLPRATDQRGRREAALGKQSGRSQEIQRLIGRSLRAVTNLGQLGERQITLDCDVLQADGGTRTASITGAYVALYQACRQLHKTGAIADFPLSGHLAAVSCGICDKRAVLDLDYEEDHTATVDANFILGEDSRLIEIQATAEGDPFSDAEFTAMLALARKGISELITAQKTALGLA